MSCPWEGWAPATTHFCEAELCAWITQPANTWSNLAYVLVGVYLVASAGRTRRPDLVVIGVVEVLIGLGSFFFHASSTHVGEVVDLGAMFLFSGLVLVKNADRLARRRGGGFSVGQRSLALVGLAGASVAVTALAGGTVGIVLFALQAWLAGHLEFLLYRGRLDPGAGPVASYRPLVALLVVFALAWAAWWIDILQVACNPDNHWFQGHAAWHVLNSACFWCLQRFYAQCSPME